VADGFVTAQISFPGVKLKVESEVSGSWFIVETTEFFVRFEMYPAFFKDNCYLKYSTSFTSVALHRERDSSSL